MLLLQTRLAKEHFKVALQRLLMMDSCRPHVHEVLRRVRALLATAEAA